MPIYPTCSRGCRRDGFCRCCFERQTSVSHRIDHSMRFVLLCVSWTFFHITLYYKFQALISSWKRFVDASRTFVLDAVISYFFLPLIFIFGVFPFSSISTRFYALFRLDKILNIFDSFGGYFYRVKSLCSVDTLSFCDSYIVYSSVS